MLFLVRFYSFTFTNEFQRNLCANKISTLGAIILAHVHVIVTVEIGIVMVVMAGEVEADRQGSVVVEHHRVEVAVEALELAVEVHQVEEVGLEVPLQVIVAAQLHARIRAHVRIRVH